MLRIADDYSLSLCAPCILSAVVIYLNVVYLTQFFFCFEFSIKCRISFVRDEIRG